VKKNLDRFKKIARMPNQANRLTLFNNSGYKPLGYSLPFSGEYQKINLILSMG
jgi:hypothetical protein